MELHLIQLIFHENNSASVLMQMMHMEKNNSLYSAMHFYLTSWEHFIVQMEPCKDKKKKLNFLYFPYCSRVWAKWMGKKEVVLDKQTNRCSCTDSLCTDSRLNRWLMLRHFFILIIIPVMIIIIINIIIILKIKREFYHLW